jgi:protein AaeX
MLSEADVGGIYVAPFMIYVATTVPVFLLLRAILARTGVLRWVWHPALFEFALSLSILSLLVLFF